MATHNGIRTGGGSASSTSVATTAAITVAVGDGISLGIKHEGGTATVTVADNLGNTYTQVGTTQAHANGDLHSDVFYCVVTNAGSCTVTGTLSAARVWRAIEAEFSTPAASTTFSLDQNTKSTGTSAAPSAGSISVTDAGVAFAFFGLYNAVAGSTPGTGWTEGTENGNGAYSEYRLPTGAGSITGDFSWVNNDVWTAHVFNLKETASGGGGTILRQMMNYH